MSGFAESDAIKARIAHALVDIPAIVRELGLDKGAKPNGRGRVVHCPWHQEREPSCGITIGESGTLRAKCFRCDGRGDIFALIAAVHRLDIRTAFPEVLGIAADMAGVALPERAPARPPVPPSREPPPRAVSARVTIDHEVAVGQQIAELCALFPIARDAGIRDGLAGRMLLEAAVEDEWGALPKTASDLEAVLADDAFADVRALFLRPDKRTGRPTLMFRDHRLLIPWRCPDGRIWSFQRRYAPKTGSESTKELGRYIPKFVWPSKEDYTPCSVYPWGAHHASACAQETTEVWIAEGATSPLSLRLLNEEGVLSKGKHRRAMTALGIPGVKALEAYVPVLPLFVRGKDVVTATDADEAGESVVPAYHAAMIAAGAKSVRHATCPANDWNDLLKGLR